MKTIRAIYEGGVFKPLEPVELEDQTTVEFQVPEPPPVQLIQKPDPERKISAICAILSEQQRGRESDRAARHRRP